MQIRMLREIDAMFESAPQNRKTLEVKEEMLQNLMEKYHDLLAEGKSEEAAFNIAIASVGDISDLLAELQQPPPRVAHFDDLDDAATYTDDQRTGAGIDYARHHKAAVVAIAAMLFILSPAALILFGGTAGILLLLCMVAGATGLLVYYGMTAEKSNRETPGEAEPESGKKKEKRSKEEKKLLDSLTSALWLITVALYFVISFQTHAWHISWIIFLIAAAASNVLHAMFDIFRK